MLLDDIIFGYKQRDSEIEIRCDNRSENKAKQRVHLAEDKRTKLRINRIVYIFN